MSGSASDVAALSFAIDSSQVVTAGQALDGLQKSSDGVSDAYDRLHERSQRFIAVARDMGESIAQMRRQFADTAQSLDQLLSGLDTARQRLDGTAASFADLADATGHVQALGESFGVTGAGIEAFAQQSAMLGLSAGQTTLALQRITEALQNQTLAGQQVRQEIQGLGVDLAGLTSNDASGVLSAVVQRLRGTQDGLGKYQTESSVLGVTDPNTLYGLNTQTYIPVAERREIARQQAVNRQSAATYDQVARDYRGYANDDAEYADLSSGYNLRDNLVGLSSAQRAQLARVTGLPTDTSFRSEDDQLTGLRYLQANPNSDLARSARSVSGRVYDAFQPGGTFGSVGSAYNHLFDGSYSRNDADINDQYQFDLRRTGGAFTFGGIGAFLTQQGRQIGNLFNAYTPQAIVADNRPKDAISEIRDNQATAETVAGFGDRSLTDIQSVQEQLRRLRDPATAATYEGAFGTIEGDSRYGATLGALQSQLKIAQTPGGQLLDQAQRQGYLLNQPQGDRDQLQALFQFLESQGTAGQGQVRDLVKNGISYRDALNLDGRSGGGGVLSPDQSIAFRTLYTQQSVNAGSELSQGFARSRDDQQRLLDATVGAGTNPLALASARYSATIGNEYLRLSGPQRNGLPLDAYSQERATNDYLTGVQRAVGQRNDEQGNYELAARRSGAAQMGGDDSSLERSIALQKQYADALAAAAQKGPEAVSALQKVVDGIGSLQAAASRADFSAKNYGQAFDANRSAAFDTYIANQPVSQRAGLQAIQGIVSQPGNNPVLDRHTDVSQADLADIQKAIRDQHLPDEAEPYIASTLRLEGAEDKRNANLPIPQQFGLTEPVQQQYGVNPANRTSVISGAVSYFADNYRRFGSLPGAAMAYHTGPNDPGLPNFIATGDTSKLLQPDAAQYAVGLGVSTPEQLIAAARENPAVAANVTAAQRQQQAGYQLQIANLRSDAAPRDAIEPQLLDLLASGQTGRASVLQAGVNTNPGSPVGSVEATQRAAEAQRSLTEEITKNLQATRSQIDDSKTMADAYAQGGDAAAKAAAAIDAHNKALATGANASQEQAQYALNLAASLGKEQEAAAKAAQALNQDSDRTKFIVGLGVTDSYDRDRQIGQYDYVQQQRLAQPQQYAANPTDFDQQSQAQYQIIQQNKDALASTNAVNSAFGQLGTAIFSTFENAAFSSQRFKATLGELLQSISQIILKLTIEQPLENLFTKTIGGWFGPSLNGIGGAGGILGYIFGGGTASAAGGIANYYQGYSTSELFARGGVFDSSGPVRMHASGSVLPGPTPFTDATGGMNIAGEAGPEAIMPLQVMPDGSLGIRGAGGGGNTTIVHTPITINNNGGGAGGGLDPATAKMVQKQIAKAATEATKQTILNNQRPGGLLFGTIPA